MWIIVKWLIISIILKETQFEIRNKSLSFKKEMLTTQDNKNIFRKTKQ